MQSRTHQQGNNSERLLKEDPDFRSKVEEIRSRHKIQMIQIHKMTVKEDILAVLHKKKHSRAEMQRDAAEYTKHDTEGHRKYVALALENLSALVNEILLLEDMADNGNVLRHISHISLCFLC